MFFWIRGYIDSGLSAKVGEYLGLIHGNIWPSENNEGTTGLLDPVVIFKDIKRPMRSFNSNEDVYIFVTNPGINYTYPIEDKFSGEGPSRGEVPQNSVFLVYVEYNQEIVEKACRESGNSITGEVDGVIHSWEWTFAADDDPSLPASHNTRFSSKV